MNAHKMTQLAIIVACLALAGCASTGAAIPTATQPSQPTISSAATIALTEIATISPTETSQSTAAPTATFTPQLIQVEPPTPENTPIPTATSYPAPAVPLSPTGPWLIFRADCYLWVMNQDGTGLTRLSNETVDTFAVRPTSSIQGGVAIAYTTASDDVCRFGRYWDDPGSAIKLLSWLGGDVRTIVYGTGKELKWSPSGGRLAFTGRIDASDTSSNVFIYDTATEESTRVAATEYNDCCLQWTTDERYVLFESTHPGMVGTLTNAVWSARADAGGATQLAQGLIDDDGWIVEYLGWLSPTESIMQWDNSQWGEDEIRITNIETGQYTTLISEPHPDVAYSPEHNLLLMTKDVAPAPNRLLIFYQNGERREVTGYTIKWVEWLSAYDVFLGQTPDGRAYLITPDGAVTEIPSPEWKAESGHRMIVSPSPDGQWWAWQNSFSFNQDASELWVGPAGSQPSALLSYSEVIPDYRVYPGDVRWSPDSQCLLWLNRKGLFVAQPPAFEAVFVAKLPGEWGNWAGHGGNEATFSDAVWVH